ncbi:hypothetical protein EON77_21125 [bacterium]|nr:MAG: hypothetical protein EON77_21125 [bacterium]
MVINIGVWLLTRARRRKREHGFDDPQAQLFVVFTLLTAFVYYKGFVRAEPLHMTLSIVPASVLAALIVDRFWDARRPARAIALALLVVSVVPSALLSGVRLVQFQRQPDRMLALNLAGLAPDAAKCPSPSRWWPMRQPSHYVLVARFLNAVVPPGEPTFIGLRYHDRIFINAVALYYTADRLPATHWHQFDPGQQTREDVQQAVIADLERSGVRYIVRDASYEEVREPNESQYSSGVHVLDEYLDSHFKPVMGAGPVEVWIARDAVASPWPSLPPGCEPDRVFD